LKHILFVALALILSLPLPAWSARPEGLYAAEVAYQGKQESAFRDALAQVLVKLTGRRDLGSYAELGPLLDSAASYVQQYRSPAPDRLWVSFDGGSLSNRLAELGLPVWGDERPTTLLWLAVDAGGGRRFVVPAEPENADEARLAREAKEAAEARGLPLVMPIMDAEDRGKASFAEVWGGFDDAILAASERYGVDNVLVGRLSAGDFDRGRWTLLSADAGERWTGGVGEAVNRAADQNAQRYAVVASGTRGTVQLTVGGLDSVEDYGRVSRFLGNLTAVGSLAVERVEGEQIVYRVGLRGDVATLDQAIRLGGLLAPDGPGGPASLSYRVRP
jgi:hypothetical protein